MNRKYLFPILVLAGCAGINGQIISPENKGDIFRAEAMVSDENWNGVLDQLSLLEKTELSESEKQRAEWLRCVATSHTDRTEAAYLLRRFISKYEVSELRYKAMALLGDCLLEEDPGEALDIYNGVDEQSLTAGELAALNYHKGYASLLADDLGEAETFFKAAREDERWRKRADFYLGYIAYSRNEYAQARKLFEQADRSVKPGNMADYYLAQIYYAEGDYAKALGASQLLLERKGTDSRYLAEATRVAGESLFQLGDTREAIPMLKKYVDMTDSPARSAIYILGTNEFNSGHPKEAIDYLRVVTEDGEEDAMTQSAYLFIGQALMARNDRNAALLAFDNALKADFDPYVQEAAYYNYAVAKFSGGRQPFGSSVATFEEYLRRYPDGRYASDVQEYLAEGYLTDGDYDTALASINRMSNPGAKVLDAKQKVLYALGTRQLATGDADKAVEYLREAQKLGGHDRVTDSQVALSLGEALARKGQHKEAVAQFGKYLSEAPNDDVNRQLGLYDRGYSYFALQDYNKAAQNFTQLMKPSGKTAKTGTFQLANLQADVYNRLGDSKLYLGNFKEAAENYRKAYELQPTSGDYPLFQMAVIEGYERNYKEKAATIERLLTEFPTSSLVPDALLEMTESYIQLRDNESAISTYRRLVSEYPNTEQGRRGYLQMALTMLNSGRRNDAIGAYRDVVSLYPTSEEARMAVDELKRISADDGTLPEFVMWLDNIDNAPKLDISDTERLIFEAAEKAWVTSNDVSRLEKYLTDFPKGSFRVRALGYLTDNAVAEGNHRDVIEFASQIIEGYPDSSQAENALMAKAEAEYALGESGMALRSWEILERRASSPQMLNAARTGIMRSARDLGDNGRVIAAADALLVSSTLGAEARNEAIFARAFAMAQAGRTADAMAEWEQLATQTDDLYGAKSAYYVAEYRFNGGEISAARKQVEELIDSGTPHTYWLARGFVLLSDIYAKEGKTFEAREYLKSLRENYPGDETEIFSMIDERLEKLKK